MAAWFWYAVVAAVFYGAHQIFTRIAADHIGEGLGGFVVEASAAFSILIYLGILWFSGRWNQKFSTAGFNYSLLTGICVGAPDNRVLSSFSKRRSAPFCSSDLGRRRRDHGYRWDSFLSRPTVVAKDRRCCVRHHWFILVT
jgi:hypothetical protein